MAFFTTDQINILKAGVVRGAWLAEMQFVSSTERYWAGNTMLDAGGHEWKPTHGLVTIDGLGFSGQPDSEVVTFNFPGLDDGLLAKAIGETSEVENRPLVLYLQLFGSDWQTVGGLIPLYTGLMQPPAASTGPIEGTSGPPQGLSMTVENIFYNRSLPPNGRYTSRDQARRVGWDDKFFDLTPSLTFKKFKYP